MESMLEQALGALEVLRDRGMTAGNSQRMKAAYLTGVGEAESLVVGEMTVPRPKENEVLVRVRAVSVTPSEFQWFTTFRLPFGEPRQFPIVLGHDFSGVVAALGGKVTGFRVGDEVFGLNDWFSNGAQAEYCTINANALARKPRSLNHAAAAVVPIPALAAWQGLFDHAKLKRGQRVLIHDVTGSVGSFAVQMAHWRGAYVIATILSGNADFARSLGADEVIDCRTTRFEDTASNVDVVFDSVGGDLLGRSWGVLAKGGRAVTIAPQSLAASDHRVRDAFVQVRADGALLTALAHLIDVGQIRVFVGKTYPLAEVRTAYASARQGKLHGHAALRLDDQISGDYQAPINRAGDII